MVLEEASGFLSTIGGIALWLQTLGVVAAILIIAEIVSFYLNARRYQQLIKIKHDMIRIERKIDKLIKK